MKNILVRSDRLDEAGEFYDRVTAYLEGHINYPKWEHGVYPSRSSSEKAIEAGELYACIYNDKIVGIYVLNDDPQGCYDAGEWKKDLKAGEYLVIHSLASDPELYGKGIARAMVRNCIKTARNKGYKALRLDVVPSNTPARQLYEKLGFTFAGEKDLLRDIDDIPEFALYELNLES